MAGVDFASAYKEFVCNIYGFFAYRLSSRADVEHLVQLTFERPLCAWGRYDRQRAPVDAGLSLATVQQVLSRLLRRMKTLSEDAPVAAAAGG
jgi:hypothetical protein